MDNHYYERIITRTQTELSTKMHVIAKDFTYFDPHQSSMKSYYAV